MAEALKVIRKSSEIYMTDGVVVDSLNSNSKKDAPSIRAVNEALDVLKAKALIIKDTIPTDDFNTMTDIGVYVITNQVMENAPEEEQGSITGTLTLTNNGDESNLIIYQKYESDDNLIYLRTYINGSWTRWTRTSTISVNEEGNKTNINLVLKVVK